MSSAENQDNSNYLQHLFPKELELIKDKKTQLTYLKGENLFKQGAFAPYVMFIVNGLVKIYLQTGYDKQINIRLARTGDFLAFSSIFGDNVYNYSAIAVKDSLVCMIDKESLKQLLLKNPEFAMQITSRNFRNENYLFEIIKNISYKQMRGKLASTLLYLSQDEFIDEEIFQYMSRQDIADFASISTESAIKFLKEFEKEGILSLNGKDIEITDKGKLEDIAQRG
ncbi:MAG: Crp/Fnr family transcriptional regulator [Bacteroidales bacterium]|nr:MAG: Crp/Fnr family transcriptional regulator [Bacteroidales bacterium]